MPNELGPFTREEAILIRQLGTLPIELAELVLILLEDRITLAEDMDRQFVFAIAYASLMLAGYLVQDRVRPDMRGGAILTLRDSCAHAYEVPVEEFFPSSRSFMDLYREIEAEAVRGERPSFEQFAGRLGAWVLAQAKVKGEVTPELRGQIGKSVIKCQRALVLLVQIGSDDSATLPPDRFTN